MYKLEKNSPWNNVVHNVRTYFPDTLWTGQSLVALLAAGPIVALTVHHPDLQANFEGIVGTIDCVIATATLGTLGCTVKNFIKERSRFLELGRQMDIEKARKTKKEAQVLSSFITPEQLPMKELTKNDKVVSLDLFRNSDDTTGGRQEETGFSKTLTFPKG